MMLVLCNYIVIFVYKQIYKMHNIYLEFKYKVINYNYLIVTLLYNVFNWKFIGVNSKK